MQKRRLRPLSLGFTRFVADGGLRVLFFDAGTLGLLHAPRKHARAENILRFISGVDAPVPFVFRDESRPAPRISNRAAALGRGRRRHLQLCLLRELHPKGYKVYHPVQVVFFHFLH